MITPYMICDKCKQPIIVPSSSIAGTNHEPDICDLWRWRAIEAVKYGMVSINFMAYNALSGKYTAEHISEELSKVYPRVASKVVRTKHAERLTIADIFVEEWAARSIELFIKNDGFAGMTLATFLDKTAAERDRQRVD